jgi:hypothetical protein
VQVTQSRKRVLGQDHPDTLSSIANLALIYWDQGRWKEAEELQVQAVNGLRTTLGEDHPSTVVSIANLASFHEERAASHPMLCMNKLMEGPAIFGSLGNGNDEQRL